MDCRLWGLTESDTTEATQQKQQQQQQAEGQEDQVTVFNAKQQWVHPFKILKEKASQGFFLSVNSFFFLSLFFYCVKIHIIQNLPP